MRFTSSWFDSDLDLILFRYKSATVYPFLRKNKVCELVHYYNIKWLNSIAINFYIYNKTTNKNWVVYKHLKCTQVLHQFFVEK